MSDFETSSEHHVAMAIHAIYGGLDQLIDLVVQLSEQDQERLELARYQIEQILIVARNPYLQRAAE